MKKMTALIAAITYLQHANAEKFIIQYQPSASPSTQQTKQGLALKTTEINHLRSISNTNLRYHQPLALPYTHVIELPDNLTNDQKKEALVRLQKTGNIASISQDTKVKRTTAPNDTHYNALWALQPNTSNILGANFETAWTGFTGSGITVAVVDTGALPHNDLGTLNINSNTSTGQFISGGYDFISDCRIAATCPSNTSSGSAVRTPQPGGFDQGDWIDASDQLTPSFSGCDIEDSSWHGTHVSGIIAAKGNNNLGVIGGAYNAKILPVRALGKCGGSFSDIINGILWAVDSHPTIQNPNPAKIINMSLGGYGSCSIPLQSAINTATNKGAIVVVAAGNQADEVSNYAPANCNNVVVVGATGKAGSRAYYSNTGLKVTIAAQGGDFYADSTGIIYSTYNDGTTTYNPSSHIYGGLQGTSMATPHVSAALALLFEKYPSLTLSQAKAALRNGSTAFPDSSCTQDTCGKGILNINNALTASLVEVSAPTPTPTPTPTPPASQAGTSGGGGGGGGSLPLNGLFSLLGISALLRLFVKK